MMVEKQYVAVILSKLLHSTLFIWLELILLVGSHDEDSLCYPIRSMDFL